MKPEQEVKQGKCYVRFQILCDVSAIESNSWVHAQYVSLGDINSENYFSGYVITNQEFSVPTVNVKMWHQESGTAEEINEKIPKYDSIIVYRQQSGDRYTFLGQTLNQ